MSRTNKKQISTPTESPDSFRNLIDQFPSLPEEKQRQIYEGIRSHFIECYLQAIEEVKREKNLSTEEKLKRLLVPLIGYSKFDPFGEPIPFVDESVDIERELDLENLRYDEERYQLYDGKGDQIDASAVHGLVTSSSYIFVREKFDSDLENYRKTEAKGRDGFSSVFDLGKISLRDLHKEWLPSLDQKTIKSKDLLDQVLVAYTIKQAQNGDGEAIEKLCSLYKDAAEALAVKFANKFGFGHEIKGLKLYAQWFLRFLITGFRLEDIISQLVELDPEREIPETEKVIKAIPPWVKSFYIYYLTEYLPQRMEKNIRETQRNQDLITEPGKLPDDGGRNQAEEIGFLKARNFFLDFQWIGMLNPYAPFRADTLWRTLKRPNRFNSYSFRPGLVKMGRRRNLTTWLFGRTNEIEMLAKAKPEDSTKAWQPYGKLYQLLRDKYKPLIKEKEMIAEKKRFITTDDAEDDFNEEYTENLTYKEKKEVPLSHFWNPPDTQKKKAPEYKVYKVLKEPPNTQENSSINKEFSEKVIERLSKHLSKRDVQIFGEWIFGDLTQSQIAERHDLSTRQVKRICQNAKKFVPTTLLK